MAAARPALGEGPLGPAMGTLPCVTRRVTQGEDDARRVGRHAGTMPGQCVPTPRYIVGGSVGAHAKRVIMEKPGVMVFNLSLPALYR